MCPSKIIAFLRPGFTALLLALLSLSAASASSNRIDAQQLRQLIADGVPVVDVRTPQEWRATGVIPDSHLMTFFDYRGNYDLESWLNEFIKIAKPHEPVVIICEIGNRSRLISHFLVSELAYSQVYDASGGIREWSALSLPIQDWP